MKVRGSVMPPEWDFASSAITVYHRTNVVEIATENGAEWEYGASTDCKAMRRNMEIQGYNISIVFA